MGVLLRTISPDHIFSGVSKRRAREVRDVVITDTTDFDRDGRLAIIVRFRDREIWQVRRDGAWVDVCVHDVDEDD